MTDELNAVALEKAIRSAIFDPGEEVGMRHDRAVSQWQTDAVMNVLMRFGLSALPPPSGKAGEVADVLADLQDLARFHEGARTSDIALRAAALITALVAERDKAQSDEALYAKALLKLRSTLLMVIEDAVDEGDRVYFGSTNDADELRDIASHIDDLAWDDIMEASQPPVDLYEIIREQRSRAEDAEAEAARLREALSGILRCEYESASHGLLDCIDNHGKHYQSQFLADQIKSAEALVGTRPHGIGDVR